MVEKETRPARPREVAAFLVPRRRHALRLLPSYAAEKMTPATRARVPA